MKSINARFLYPIVEHYYRLGFMNRLRAFPYERCAELSYVLEKLEPLFQKTLRYLDIGSGGDSPLPTWLLANTRWDITCVDKCAWIQNQLAHAARVARSDDIAKRFQVIERDFLKTELQRNSFDVITSISVIEHFEGTSDTQAMVASAELLRPDGLYILSTPINEGFYREIYVERNVYGEHFELGKTVFYQRHYDTNAIRLRLIEPSGLVEVYRIYFGDYDRQFFEELSGSLIHRIVNIPKRFNIPTYAQRHLSFSDKPVSRARMKDNTASGVIIILMKGATQASPKN